MRDELMLDGNARLNLATFVTTWMEPQARELMAETAEKNLADRAEYPQITAMEERCVRMLARLWHAPRPEQVRGCSTTGSSEAAMLGGLALKRRWQARRRAQGKDTARPNLVMGSNVQVCWKKFANYFEVEPRYVPMEPGRYHLTPDTLTAYCDDNTIGVVTVLGSTYDGSYEPVADICLALDGYQAATGTDIPVHVDGASGAMVAPFLDPGLMWDFQLERVASINTSGHKYGHVFPGLGWALWRDSRRPARRPGLRGRLPGRQLAQFHPQLLPPGRARRSAVLQLPPVRLRRAAQPRRPEPYDGACAGRPDPLHRPLRAGHGRLRTPRLHLPRGTRHPGPHGVRRLPVHACPRLAPARVHLPGALPGRLRPACGRTHRVHRRTHAACSSPT